MRPRRGQPQQAVAPVITLKEVNKEILDDESDSFVTAVTSPLTISNIRYVVLDFTMDEDDAAIGVDMAVVIQKYVVEGGVIDSTGNEASEVQVTEIVNLTLDNEDGTSVI